MAPVVRICLSKTQGVCLCHDYQKRYCFFISLRDVGLKSSVHGTHLQNTIVEQQNEDAGDEEGKGRGDDDEVGVVEDALRLVGVGGGVEAEEDGHAEDEGEGPDAQDGQNNATVVVGLLLL